MEAGMEISACVAVVKARKKVSKTAKNLIGREQPSGRLCNPRPSRKGSRKYTTA
jgi:hypothetical protein